MSATTLVGLDIGSTSIRAVEASSNKDRTVLHRFGQIALPPDAVVAGVVKDSRAVSGALRELWASRDFGTKDVAVGVTHQQVVVREVEIPNVAPRERRQALPHLVRDVLPLPVDQALLDFYPLETPASDKGGTIRGLLIAAPKDAVLDTVHAVESAGLHVAKVDLACFAALRAAGHLNNETEALLDIGATGTNVIIHSDGTPMIVRTIPRGGSEITKMLASRLELDTEAAEAVKRSVGVNYAEHHAAADVVSEALRPFVTEIRTSMNYFGQANPDNRIHRLALVGGASRLPGLADMLAETLNLPTYHADPLQRVNDSRKGRHDDLRSSRSSASVAIGLTLGAA